MQASPSSSKSLEVSRHYTPIDATIHEVFGEVTWVKRRAEIRSGDKIIFEMDDVEVPEFWSQLATDILASKYFRKAGLKGRGVYNVHKRDHESSLREVVYRIVHTIGGAGESLGYFDANNRVRFEAELAYMIVHQIGAFNSPVWFNVGLWHEYSIKGNGDGNWAWPWGEDSDAVEQMTNAYERPQGSACFILHAEDDLMHLFENIKTEVRLFKGGSGSGINFDKIRGKGESLSGGGTSSGLLSWLKVYDTAAGSIKSGGVTRRAATIRILSMDHPDIEDFIGWKTTEEKKARALIAQGYSSDFNGEAYATVSGQNSNNSIRASDKFMRAVESGDEWTTTARINGKPWKTYQAKDLWRSIAQAAWECADPGVQFDDTINKWHMIPSAGRVRSSNPCCITAESLVLSSDGLMTIDQLHTMHEAGDPLPYARTYDPKKGTFVLAIIEKVWVAGETCELVDVTTRSGITIRCTHEHPFLLESGEYVEAVALRAGMFLRGSKDSCLFDNVPRIHTHTPTSDEVVSVVRVHTPAPIKVYDMQIADHHSFAVTSSGAPYNQSIVVHNSEHMAIDNSACNLSSLNLVKFDDADGFQWGSFQHAARVFTLAMDILVDLSSYPTKEIATNAHKYRHLGLGYANLGALLMRCGMPYDSPEGRLMAAEISSRMTTAAWKTSSEIASVLGPVASDAADRPHMINVLQMHHDAAVDVGLSPTAQAEWRVCMAGVAKHGARNAQTTLLAPTGTISLSMDCDTSGIEPDFSLVKFKKLAGGGYIKYANMSVGAALSRLGYSKDAVATILDYIQTNDTYEGAPFLDPEDYPVFDCANRCGNGERYIKLMGHVEMMAAVQPFLDSAISKTCNAPNSITVEEIEKVYFDAWKMGLKSITIYRDGCKASQPLNSKSDTKADSTDEKAPSDPTGQDGSTVVPESAALPAVTSKFARVSHRRQLPTRRRGFTQKARVGGHKVYVRTGEYPDGTLGEIFIDLHKEGATLRSMMNLFAMAVSLGLQHGVPLERFVDQFTFTRFEPQGSVECDPHVKFATSIPDYVFRMLAVEYLKRHDLAHVQPTSDEVDPEAREVNATQPTDGDLTLLQDSSAHAPTSAPLDPNRYYAKMMSGAPACSECGNITVRNGTCWKCMVCGSSQGCS